MAIQSPCSLRPIPRPRHLPVFTTGDVLTRPRAPARCGRCGRQQAGVGDFVWSWLRYGDVFCFSFTRQAFFFFFLSTCCAGALL